MPHSAKNIPVYAVAHPTIAPNESCIHLRIHGVQVVKHRYDLDLQSLSIVSRGL
jgi:hypothetical protein